ncbi:MAG: efflux RND transporter periplasmic adaptor subunit [Kiritimatiellales bacterium]|nr:efflux RND transporter periplasmic adaptor subunit [Kiritimatiellales bacterium]
MRKTTVALICLGLLAIAIGCMAIMIKTAPTAEKKSPPKMAALVDVLSLNAADETVVLHLTGTVVPNEEVMLRARVGGEVVSTAPEFLEGGLFKKGDPILEIDPADYKLALAAAASALETARFNYKLELGRQDVAKREWALLKTDDATEMERELALRIPHLAASKAALEAAEATVEKTRLDLARTDIRAPFNAVVLGANVNEGSQASQQDVLAHLAGTDAYWVIVSIPVDRLGWVAIPGSKAKLVSTSDAVREGRVIKLFGDLEEKGRMARLLVEVEDPLCLKPENKGGKPLLLGEYVRVEIDGRTLRNVYSIPRKALHGNTQIWIATPDNTLDIREVDVLWRDAQQVLIHDGLSADEQLIVSDLTAPIQGMDVNTGTTPSNKE